MRVFFWISRTFQHCWGKTNKEANSNIVHPVDVNMDRVLFKEISGQWKKCWQREKQGDFWTKIFLSCVMWQTFIASSRNAGSIFHSWENIKGRVHGWGLAAGNIILKIQIYKSDDAGVLVALRPIWTAAFKDLNIFLFYTSISVDVLLERYFQTPGHCPLQSTNLMKCNPLYSCQLRSWPIISKIDIKHYYYITSFRKR